MRYTITSDIPGRLSVRLGRGLVTPDEARGIAVLLLGLEGVRSVEAHEANGAFFISCTQEGRAAALGALTSLDVLALPQVAEDGVEVPHELEESMEANRFGLEVSGIVLWHVARRLALPAPLQAAYAVAQGATFVLRGLRELVRGRVTVEVLDATAIGMSLARGSFADASTVMLLLRLTDALERHVQRRVRIALSEGLVTRPEVVWQVVDGQDVQIPITAVREGQVLHLGSGQVLPVDGTVQSGVGEVNEASMTGEPDLVRKEAGDTVFAGTALESGDLRVLVTAAPGRSRIDGIARMVEESSGRKAQVQGRAERMSDGLVPVSLAAFLGIWGLTGNISKAMAVLMVDYSCAVRVSVPLCVMSAMSDAMRHDVVVKGGRYLEAFAEADTVVFDKTGTLTHACPRVARVLALGDMSEDDTLRYAACIEEHFPHSVARAVVAAAQERGLDHAHELHAEVTYVVAHGIRTQVDGKVACIGSWHFVFEDEGVPVPEGLAELLAREAQGLSTVFLAVDGRLEGVLCIEDPLRADAAQVVAALRDAGLSNVALLTGDAEASAVMVAAQVGADDYLSQVQPEDKSRYVRRLRAAGHTVVMVGDGINDSPALAAADVSVALADASDIARAVSDISVMDASLERLVDIRALSCALMRRIHADYRFIVGFNTALIALGVGGLISLTAAAYLHNASTLAIAVASARPHAVDWR